MATSCLVYALLPGEVNAFSFTNTIKQFFITEYDSLQDIENAPKEIRKISSAVFRFEGGTGSFVKFGDEIFIMTNNHVLGYKHCSRKGCFAKAVFNYEKGKQAVFKNLFVTPAAVSEDVDVSFFRFKEINEAGDFMTVRPNLYLEFETNRAEVGETVYPIGHPRTSIKKFSSGQVVKYENGYMHVNALTLPGNSGSPIVNIAGKIIGIHHSSVKRNDGFTREGLLYVGRASSSPAILKVLEAGLSDPDTLLAKFWNVDRAVSFSSAKSFTRIYKKSKTIPMLTTGKDFFETLYDDCSRRLDLETTRSAKFARSHESCSVALNWIGCAAPEKEVSVKYILASTLTDSHPDFDGYGSYCPRGKMKSKWANLFLKIGRKYRDFHGKDPLVWTAEGMSKLASDPKRASKIASTNIRKELNNSNNMVSVSTILMLSQYSSVEKIDKINGIDLVELVKKYREIPNYEYDLADIADATQALYENNHLDKDELKEIVDSILAESQLSLNAKLAVEKIAFEKDVL